MPLGWGSATFTTSADIGGGRNFTRLKGPLLIGQVEGLGSSQFGGVGGPVGSYSPPHVVNVSTAPADIIMTGGVIMTTSMTVGFTYIGTTTVGFTSSSTANVGPTPVSVVTKGAALIFDTARKKLSIFSTDVGDWLSVTLSSS
jgi:hypothetical protein